MKIAIMSFHSGIEKRGVERWSLDFANLLAKRHEVTVLQNGPKDTTSTYGVFRVGIPYDSRKKEIFFPFQKRFFLDYKPRKIAYFTIKLLPMLWRENFDIVVPTDGGWEPAFIRLLTWLRRKKMVIVGHAGIGWDDMNNLWSFPDRFVGLSKFAVNWAKKINPFIKTVYIPNGVDLQEFDAAGEKLKLSLEKPIILAVGALELNKRIDLIIKAVSKIRKGSLLVVGRGEMKEEISTLGEKLLGDRFILKDYDFSDMPMVYRSCSVLASASLPYYSFEMVLLEAMAANLAVVANNDPIRREIVGDGGILVDPTDINAFSKGLGKALEINWGDTPRKQAEKFSWEKVAEKYENLFQEILDSR